MVLGSGCYEMEKNCQIAIGNCFYKGWKKVEPLYDAKKGKCTLDLQSY